MQALNDYNLHVNNEHNYSVLQSKLKGIKSYPFIYWISDQFRETFKGADIKSLLSPAQGAATTNNLRFLRFWWEVSPSTISEDYLEDKKKWVTYAKGGPYEKWCGNLWLVGNYENEALEMKSAGAVLRNRSLYLSEGVTYSASGSKGASFRHLPKNSFFDTGGSCIFANKEFKNNSYLLGFMNSKLVSYLVSCLNPTVNAQVGDMQRVPFKLPPKGIEDEVSRYVNTNVNIKNKLNLDHFFERNSKQYPFVSTKEISTYLHNENHLITQVLINEAIINDKIFEVYNLTDLDKDLVISKEKISIASLPVLNEARSDFYEFMQASSEFPLSGIKSYIDFLPTYDFSIDEIESIENEFHSLYQKNNSLEEFCIRNELNPINVWYWFKKSNTLPKQKVNKLSFEYLADVIKEILNDDEDGIIPIVSNAGEKILLDRVEEKFIKRGFSMAQYSGFDSVLGRPIKDFIDNHFFTELTECLNLFMYMPKTPFVWHLTSGPEQGFDCYISIYKWSRDNLMRIRSVYIEHRERALMNRQSDLANKESVDAQNEKDKIFKQLKEIEAFKVKIDELLEEGYDPILDDGVGKNIAPLQQKKMLAYDVLNAGQLKKFLNADW